eukprot:9469904-Pyramimonas_sp.AAC.1
MAGRGDLGLVEALSEDLVITFVQGESPPASTPAPTPAQAPSPSASGHTTMNADSARWEADDDAADFLFSRGAHPPSARDERQFRFRVSFNVQFLTARQLRAA